MDFDDRIEFAEGDLVRIIPPDLDEQESLIDAIGYADNMHEEIGTIKAITEVTEHRGYVCYRLNGSRWLWAQEWLELVEDGKSKITFTDEDFDSALD